ncbi:hypothetical protein TNCV_3211031 [Trichonephila clavipes]|uniref:C2H2-type domain-containing protein n=1 Tax=Trichonephila clavipes TaxID=2585209 RepID=A0A8X6S2M8_TRICX|nr:hypothetical protein TNCV_3211031 [Trichonephila clavipes]
MEINILMKENEILSKNKCHLCGKFYSEGCIKSRYQQYILLLCPTDLRPNVTRHRTNGGCASRSKPIRGQPYQPGAGRPYCDICGQTQATKKGLTYHMLRCHGVTVGKGKKKKESGDATEDPQCPRPLPQRKTNNRR